MLFPEDLCWDLQGLTPTLNLILNFFLPPLVVAPLYSPIPLSSSLSQVQVDFLNHQSIITYYPPGPITY